MRRLLQSNPPQLVIFLYSTVRNGNGGTVRTAKAKPAKPQSGADLSERRHDCLNGGFRERPERFREKFGRRPERFTIERHDAERGVRKQKFSQQAAEFDDQQHGCEHKCEARPDSAEQRTAANA